MKRCPECGREYDSSMMFCLDDGAELLYGPAAVGEPPASGESATVIFSAPKSSDRTTADTAILQPPAAVGGAEQLSSKKFYSASRTVTPLIAGVVAFVLLIGALLGYRYFRSNARQIESIAVMPFVNESGNADVEYLSDGMTEMLISTLSHLANVDVKPRSSVFRYKGKDTDPRTIGKELGVQAVLNGRVTQRGEDISLYIELIDLGRDKTVWSETYNRQQSDIVSLEKELARDVTQKLSVKLSGADEQKLSKTYTSQPEAHRAFLRGRHEWNKFSLAGLTKGISYFEQAVRIDRN
ncbi:MAG: hypothetical protein ABI791_15960 [Acidobacteriota bacterium]